MQRRDCLCDGREIGMKPGIFRAVFGEEIVVVHIHHLAVGAGRCPYQIFEGPVEVAEIEEAHAVTNL